MDNEDYDVAAGAAGIRCHHCEWAPSLDEIRANLSGTGSAYHQAMDATRRLLREHKCPELCDRAWPTAQCQLDPGHDGLCSVNRPAAHRG